MKHSVNERERERRKKMSSIGMLAYTENCGCDKNVASQMYRAVIIGTTMRQTDSEERFSASELQVMDKCIQFSDGPHHL